MWSERTGRLNLGGQKASLLDELSDALGDSTREAYMENSASVPQSLSTTSDVDRPSRKTFTRWRICLTVNVRVEVRWPLVKITESGTAPERNSRHTAE
jgi:hypothetical protein